MPSSKVLIVITIATAAWHGQADADAGKPRLDWKVVEGYHLAANPFDHEPESSASREVDTAQLDPAQFVKREPFGPSWSYQAGSGGPVVAVESLGSSKKGRPKLVHVALDWEF